jgi:hypothetical protein
MLKNVCIHVGRWMAVTGDQPGRQTGQDKNNRENLSPPLQQESKENCIPQSICHSLTFEANPAAALHTTYHVAHRPPRSRGAEKIKSASRSQNGCSNCRTSLSNTP